MENQEKIRFLLSNIYIYIRTSQAILALKGRKSRGKRDPLYLQYQVISGTWRLDPKWCVDWTLQRASSSRLGNSDPLMYHLPVPDHCLNSPVVMMVMANTGWCFQTLSQYWFLRNSELLRKTTPKPMDTGHDFYELALWMTGHSQQEVQQWMIISWFGRSNMSQLLQAKWHRLQSASLVFFANAIAAI